jgi:hypothetical protein
VWVDLKILERTTSLRDGVLMRVRTFGGLALVVTIGGCLPQEPAQTQAFSGPAAGQWGPGQPGYHAPIAYPQQGYGAPGTWTPGQAAPNYGAPPAPAPAAQQQPAWGWFPLLPPAPHRPVDVAALRSLVGKVPCAPREMAPGEWVMFDCALFTPVTRALGLTAQNMGGDATRLGFLPTGKGPTGPLPDVVDHRSNGTEGPIKNQKAVGACTAFSLSTAMDHAIRKSGRQDVVSPLHVWSKYAVPTMGAAGDNTLDKSITVEGVWPYDPVKACKLSKNPMDHCSVAYRVSAGSAMLDPQIQAEKARADASGRYRPATIEKLDYPVNPAQVAAVLAGGDDVWTSFSVNTDAWESKALKSGIIPDYDVSESTGHAVVLAGYKTINGRRHFLIHNSWGENWGERGYGWISEDMVRKHMRMGYKVKIADASAPSLPGQQPSAGACPNGQVKDSVLGSCAARCQSGSAPAAGVCLPTVPGLPSILDPAKPQPQQPQPQPQPNKSACPAGQAPDLMNGQCTNLCPTKTPSMGGMCLPIAPR